MYTRSRADDGARVSSVDRTTGQLCMGVRRETDWMLLRRGVWIKMSAYSSKQCRLIFFSKYMIGVGLNDF